MIKHPWKKYAEHSTRLLKMARLYIGVHQIGMHPKSLKLSTFVKN